MQFQKKRFDSFVPTLSPSRVCPSMLATPLPRRRRVARSQRLRSANGVNRRCAIEGEAAREAARECGQQTSFNWATPNSECFREQDRSRARGDFAGLELVQFQRVSVSALSFSLLAWTSSINSENQTGFARFCQSSSLQSCESCR